MVDLRCAVRRGITGERGAREYSQNTVVLFANYEMATARYRLQPFPVENSDSPAAVFYVAGVLEPDGNTVDGSAPHPEHLA